MADLYLRFMKERSLPLLSVLASLSCAFFVNCLSAEPINLSVGAAAQSSTLSTFEASLALDGVTNFTHTVSSDTNPTWQVLLPEPRSFETVTILSRNSVQQRMRDITIEIVSFNGNVNSDFTGGSVVYSSPLLNPDNAFPG